jgi:hypothetical protein
VIRKDYGDTEKTSVVHEAVKFKKKRVKGIISGIVVSVTVKERFRVRFPVLPHFLRSSGSRMGSTQPHEELFQRNSSSSLENQD